MGNTLCVICRNCERESQELFRPRVEGGAVVFEKLSPEKPGFSEACNSSRQTSGGATADGKLGQLNGGKTDESAAADQIGWSPYPTAKSLFANLKRTPPVKPAVEAKGDFVDISDLLVSTQPAAADSRRLPEQLKPELDGSLEEREETGSECWSSAAKSCQGSANGTPKMEAKNSSYKKTNFSAQSKLNPPSFAVKADENASDASKDGSPLIGPQKHLTNGDSTLPENSVNNLYPPAASARTNDAHFIAAPPTWTASEGTNSPSPLSAKRFSTSETEQTASPYTKCDADALMSLPNSPKEIGALRTAKAECSLTESGREPSTVDETLESLNWSALRGLPIGGEPLSATECAQITARLANFRVGATKRPTAKQRARFARLFGEAQTFNRMSGAASLRRREPAIAAEIAHGEFVAVRRILLSDFYDRVTAFGVSRAGRVAYVVDSRSGEEAFHLLSILYFFHHNFVLTALGASLGLARGFEAVLNCAERDDAPAQIAAMFACADPIGSFGRVFAVGAALEAAKTRWPGRVVTFAREAALAQQFITASLCERLGGPNPLSFINLSDLVL